MSSDVTTTAALTAGGLHGCLLAGAGTDVAAGLPGDRALAVATLVSWLVTEGLGAYMLGSWVAGGGLRQQRAGAGRVSRPVVFGHAGLAFTGFACWVTFVVTGSAVLAWLAIGLLAPAIGFGVSAVTLWTPYPVRRAGRDDGPAAGASAVPAVPAVPVMPAAPSAQVPGDEAAPAPAAGDMLARALSDEALSGRLVDDLLARMLAEAPPAPRRPKGHLAPLIPAAHGVFALVTVLLAMLAAVAAR